MRARRSLRRITEHDLKASVQYYGAIFCIYDMEGGVYHVLPERRLHLIPYIYLLRRQFRLDIISS